MFINVEWNLVSSIPFSRTLPFRCTSPNRRYKRAPSVFRNVGKLLKRIELGRGALRSVSVRVLFWNRIQAVRIDKRRVLGTIGIWIAVGWNRGC